MIKCAEQSPRICEDGTIKWYEGDTFQLEFDYTFTDENGNVIAAGPDDKIRIYFTSKASLLNVYEAEVVGTNKLLVNVDEDVTKLFKAGEYEYNVRREAQFITTLNKQNKVVVE